MNTPVKIGGFILGLAAVFAASLGVGTAVGPAPVTDAAPAYASQPDPMTDAAPAYASQPDPMTMGNTDAAAMVPELPGALAMTEDGYTLDLVERSLPAGPQERLVFRILGADGAAVTGYDVSHDKQLHLIVVRRDLTGFQHVHPTLATDGTWSVPLDLSAAGEYRVIADFVSTGHDGLTLGADLSVAGDYRPQPLPLPSATAVVDGYTVTLDGQLIPGQAAALTLSVSKDGKPVTDLQPDGAPGGGVTPAGPGVTFYATAPTAGDYRLFLDFQHDGVVRTAEFTAHAPAAPRPAGPDHGH